MKENHKQNKVKNRIIALIVIIGAISFSPMLFNDFTYYSDNIYILDNDAIQHFNSGNFALYFTTYFDGHYHPLTLISLALNYAVHGTNPSGYQITNLFLYLLCIIAAFKFCERLTRNIQVSFFASLLFAVHPLHVESVCRITERKDLLYGLFFLLALYYYLKYIDSEYKKKWFFAGILFFVLSLLSKAQAVTLPLVWLLLDYFRNRSFRSFRIWLEKIPLLGLSLLMGIITYYAQKYTGYLNESPAHFSDTIINVCRVLNHYFARVILPVDLSPHYPLPSDTGSGFQYLHLAIIPVLVAIFWLIRKNKPAITGLLFYLITLFIMLRIVPVADNFAPDRYNFIPILGLCLWGSYALHSLSLRYKKIAFTTGVLVVLFMISLTIPHTRVWKNGYTVWSSVLKKYPGNIPAMQNIATYYMRKGDQEKALTTFRNILAIDSTNTHTGYFAGLLLLQKHRPDSAKSLFKHLKQVHYSTAADWNNMALIASNAGDSIQALTYLLKSLTLNPAQPKVWFNLAGTMAIHKRFREASFIFSFCEKYPLSWKPHIYYTHSLSLFSSGFLNESRALANKAFQYNPSDNNYISLRKLITETTDKFNPDIIIDRLNAEYLAAFFEKSNAHYYAVPYLKWLYINHPVQSEYRERLIRCIYESGQSEKIRSFVPDFKMQDSFLIKKEIENMGIIRNCFLKFNDNKGLL